MSGITLQGAGYDVAGKVILSDLSLHLTEPRIGIIGRNGSGKTTLLRLIAGLIAPTAGTVRVEGADPFHDRKAALAALGILFQNPDHQILFPTVEEELAFGLRQQGLTQPEALATARAALKAEGRDHWARAAVSTLSGGQRHWLCLQAVLLMQPATILLDEPFAGLDLPTQGRMARRLAALPQRLITISHDPAAVAGADRILWLE
ncbi:MAG: ABC transporter ATP-binding protein, partial [Paracoccaceae bacterium]